ncbi:MAG: D-galactarate dehydratase [Paracoccaceae bacterium]|nr:D-galactarate dehydratase [Paracoccaceae bacterium]
MGLRSFGGLGMRAGLMGATLVLADCGALGLGGTPGAAPAPLLAAPEAVTVAPLPKPTARVAEEFDTTTPAQRAAAAAAPLAAETRLGTTIASLGDPTDPGFWLKTPLVSAPAKGRVAVAGGASAQVDLLPLAGAPGAGSQISLPALRLLGMALTDLPELTVYRQ